MWSLWREAEWEAAQASTITKTATALERGLLCLASDCGTFEPFRLSQTAQSVAGVTISNSQSDRLVRDGTSLFHAVIRCALPVNRQQASQLFYMCPLPSISDEKSSGAVSLVNQTNPTRRSLVLLEAWVGDRIFVCMPSTVAKRKVGSGEAQPCNRSRFCLANIGGFQVFALQCLQFFVGLFCSFWSPNSFARDSASSSVIAYVMTVFIYPGLKLSIFAGPCCQKCSNFRLLQTGRWKIEVLSTASKINFIRDRWWSYTPAVPCRPKLLLGPCSATQCESRQGKFWKEQLMTQRCCESKETLHISNLIWLSLQVLFRGDHGLPSIAPECWADSAQVFW